MVRNSTRLQLLRYACVGLGTNLLLYLAYLGLTSAGVGHKTAMTLLYATGVLLTFVANSSWSFERPSLSRMAFGRYLMAHVAGYALNWMLLWVAVDHLHLAHQAVQAAAIVLVAMVLFLLHKFWVFPPPEPSCDFSSVVLSERVT